MCIVCVCALLSRSVVTPQSPSIDVYTPQFDTTLRNQETSLLIYISVHTKKLIKNTNNI